MSIKSDKWIKRQCMEAEFMVFTPDEGGIVDVDNKPVGTWEPFYGTEEQAKEYSYKLRGHHARSLADLKVYKNTARNSDFKPMIEPFCPEQIRTKERADPDPRNIDSPIIEKVTSYGLSSYGYDIRAADEFKVFTNINSCIVDPKKFDEKCFVEVSGQGYCIIPPNSFALARTVEYFRIPRNVLTICLGKSTYARCGIIVNVTPFEPEWEGYVTLEFSNTTPLPAKIYANEGIAQVLFFESDEECEVSYKDRGGKYQNQGASPVPPRM